MNAKNVGRELLSSEVRRSSRRTYGITQVRSGDASTVRDLPSAPSPSPLGFVVRNVQELGRTWVLDVISREPLSGTYAVTIRALGSERLPLDDGEGNSTGSGAICYGVLDFQRCWSLPHDAAYTRVLEALATTDTWHARFQWPQPRLPSGTSYIGIRLTHLRDGNSTIGSDDALCCKAMEPFYVERRKHQLGFGNDLETLSYGFFMHHVLATERINAAIAAMKEQGIWWARSPEVVADALYNITLRLYGGFESVVLTDGTEESHV